MAVLTQIVDFRRGPVWRRCAASWLLGIVLAFGLAPGSTAAEPTVSQVKSVFLFNFAQFVEWPARAFQERTSPFVIGVLGDDPFGADLDNVVRGEKIGARPLVVRRYKHADELTDCHILFICRSETKDLEKILAELKGKSVLTVSDVDTFTRLGGMVRLFTEKVPGAPARVQVRFKINVDAAIACGLTPSSKILRPGTIVTPDNN